MSTETTPTRPLLKQLLHERRAAAVSTEAHDPRAVPVVVHWNVSIPETCEFYGVADAISHCRMPRSCQDCLATPGCGITSHGKCRNTTSDADHFKGRNDYRSASFSNTSLVSTTDAFNFFAGTATYCKASDPVCIECREAFQHIAKTTESVSTQFCLGDGGCVCIGVCEVLKQRAYLTVDWECGPPYFDEKYLPRVSHSRRATARSDPRSPVVSVNHVSKKAETCAYTAELDVRGCRRPRTCQECLLKPGCMISDGQCTGMDEYNSFFDFHQASFNRTGVIDAVGVQFPSTNTTYCSLNDAVCASCRKAFRKRQYLDWFSLSKNSYYCIGGNGCVCIQACESDLRSEYLYDEECNQFQNRYAPANPGIFLVAIVGVLMVLWLSLKCCKGVRHTSRQGREQTRGQVPLWRNMLDEVPALTRLDLFGWRAHREELYMREQELLHGLDVAPVRPPVTFDDMIPSAPDFEEDYASAPTAQDPKALASAPFYRSSFNDGEGDDESSWSSRQETDHSSPSAPDFEMDDLEWESGLVAGHDERVGLVTRRSRRNERDS